MKRDAVFVNQFLDFCLQIEHLCTLPINLVVWSFHRTIRIEYQQEYRKINSGADWSYRNNTPHA